MLSPLSLGELLRVTLKLALLRLAGESLRPSAQLFLRLSLLYNRVNRVGCSIISKPQQRYGNLGKRFTAGRANRFVHVFDPNCRRLTHGGRISQAPL